MKNLAHSRGRRGSSLLGFAGIIAMMSGMCAILMLRSTEMYRDGAMLEFRLQARAAAEGAALLLADGQVFDEPLRIGSCDASVEPLSPENSEDFELKIDVHTRNDVYIMTVHYLARLKKEGEKWQLVTLVKE